MCSSCSGSSPVLDLQAVLETGYWANRACGVTQHMCLCVCPVLCHELHELCVLGLLNTGQAPCSKGFSVELIFLSNSNE